MSEQKGAYAVGSLPVIGASASECDKAYWAREGLIKRQQEEIQRLRAALEQITAVIEDSPVKTYQRMEQIANKVLYSSPDTGDTRRSRTD